MAKNDDPGVAPPQVTIDVLEPGDPEEYTTGPRGQPIRRARSLRELLDTYGDYEFDLPVEGVVPGHDSVHVSLNHLRGADLDQTLVIISIIFHNPDPALQGAHHPDWDIPPHRHDPDNPSEIYFDTPEGLRWAEENRRQAGEDRYDE